MKNLSTRKLKRAYFKWLKKYWNWRDNNLEYARKYGPAGYEKREVHLNLCLSRAAEAKAELIHRGYPLP